MIIKDERKPKHVRKCDSDFLSALSDGEYNYIMNALSRIQFGICGHIASENTEYTNIRWTAGEWMSNDNTR